MNRLYPLVFFLSLLPTFVLAQSQYQQATDAVLVNIDKSGITSGILYDRVFPAADLREPSQPSSPGHFRQAQAELYYASYNRNERLTPEDLTGLIWQDEQNGVVPIGVLVADFQVSNTDALELDGDNHYRLKNGYTNSQLYQTKQAVIASVLSFSVATNTAVGFQVPRWATFTNIDAEITTVTINFGEGQTRTLTPGDAPIYVYYAGQGEKTLYYTINLSDGTQRSTTANLTVNRGTNDCTTCFNRNSAGASIAARYDEPLTSDRFGNIEKLVVESDEAFQGYDESAASKGKGNAYFYYAEGRNGNELRKPFIVLDGFDAGDARGPNELYRNRLRYTNSSGGPTLLGDELRTNDPVRQNEPDFNSDVVLLNFPKYEIGTVQKTICGSYTPRGSCRRLEQIRPPILRDGGVDYIERNALVLVKLITTINARLQQSGSTEKITLVGPSMGGLISRYALRYMELRGMNHNCKLWVSFDSPHNGANIPIGGQQFLDYFANGFGNEGAKAALSAQIDSPAAKQMLLHHYRNGDTVGGAPGFRDRFVSTLNTFGYPQSACLRKVALNNGSKNGTAQPLGSCQEAMYLKARLTNGGTVVCFLVGSLVSPFLAALGCATGRDRILEARVYTAPTNSNRCLTMRSAFTAFGVGTTERYASGRGGNQPSLDTQPGGYYNVLGEIASEATTDRWLYRIDASNYFPKASFIPTVSSYGLYDTNRNWGASLTGINKQTETPFNDIYAPDQNEDHVLLTQAGVTFVRDQIREANRQSCGSACSFAIAPSPSDGNINRSCGQAVTLNANCSGSDCRGINYTWSGNGISGSGTSVNVNVPGSNGSYTYTVTASKAGCANQTGTVTLSVSGCGPVGLATNACYTIKSQKTGKRLQAMGDNSIQQQNSNGANDQLWKVDDRGNGNVSFAVQDGSNRAIQTTNGANNGGGLALSSYAGNGQYDWRAQANPADANLWRVFYPANNNTWDLQNYGNDPYLQIYGNTGESFFDYRSFRFEAATCPGGGTTCNFTPSVSSNVSNPTCGQAVTLQGGCSGGDCNGVSYSWSGNGISGSGTSVNLNVPNTNGSYTYTLTQSRAGCGNQPTASITLTVTGCGTGSGGSVLTAVRAYFRTDNCGVCQDRCADSFVQGSTDNVNWTTLSTFPRPNPGWNDYTVNGAAAYRYLRYVAAGGCYGELNELEFYAGGTKLSGSPIGGGSPANNDPGLVYQSALDGNLGTFWHGSNTGSQNFAGLDLGNGGSNTGGCQLPTNVCYTINVDQTGKRLQAMDDNSVQQQTGNGASNQVWKLTDRGNGQVSFTSQDGSNRVIQPVGAPTEGAGISLGGYAGSSQHWVVTCNPSVTNQWRVYAPTTDITWDLQGFASLPGLQLYGNTGESFVTYRSFRFESTGCPNGRVGMAEPLSVETELRLTVSPNPNGGQFRVRFQTRAGEAATLRLSDVRGRSVRALQTIIGTGGLHEEAISLPAQVHGVVLLEVISGTRRGTLKVLVE